MEKPRLFARLILINLLLLTFSLYWSAAKQNRSVQIAVAKGQHLLTVGAIPELDLDTDAVVEISSVSGAQFVNAVRLSLAEARPWQEQGCGHYNCAHAIFYDYAEGGTLNTIVHLDDNRVVATWADRDARPGGSTFILPDVVAIAAADPQVQAILGDIGAADPVMVPMSGWLADDACREAWCVDLTFHDPAGSGRIFHVFVNMEQSRVARTFYTRGRPLLDVPAPVAQRGTFDDGCHEQYGWQVCWEMTAHDGINFRDATYQGVQIFSSIKITQIEAWYPSWPGGYRDEIGFSATVPPFGNTEINDFGDSFEIRQLFTEFLHWPNCICCYRYEQIIRFYADGTFEPRFVSHGPGCDDLSIYRPFWRIDLDLNGPENNEVWVWEENQWVAAETEQELFPFVDDLAPGGEKVATFNGDIHYRWQMLRTDPLGLDEARVFILQDNEMEGEGPVVTGPGDTFQPPRQWINGDPVSGEDIVIWYVPLLKTKKGGPWWCMPDPEPGINQCEAILRLEPGGPLHQPTTEELAQMETPTPLPTPRATTEPAPIPTPRPVQGDTVEEIILNSGCGACHTIGELGEAGKVGPDLSNIGALAEARISGMAAANYLRQSILEPNAFIAPECPNGPCLSDIMPADYAIRLTPIQVSLIVDFLLTQKSPAPESVTVIGADTPAEPPTPLTKAAAAKGGIVPPPPGGRVNLMVQLLLLCIVFVLTLFMVRKRP